MLKYSTWLMFLTHNRIVCVRNQFLRIKQFNVGTLRWKYYTAHVFGKISIWSYLISISTLQYFALKIRWTPEWKSVFLMLEITESNWFRRQMISWTYTTVQKKAKSTRVTIHFLKYYCLKEIISGNMLQCLYPRSCTFLRSMVKAWFYYCYMAWGFKTLHLG